ncbi:hypothetical protein [Pedobacter sp. KACC 23697]|uniref:Uncharacterized protein n=1 Tax=Pedobacter sp. KACC 23697 TaxID=3149230 RepID=A0AAU7K747_9SPHI
MSLDKLYEKHDQQKKSYHELRDKTWSDMKQRHLNITAAFQSRDNLPEGYVEQMDQEVDTFNHEWSIPDGVKYKTLLLKQEEEITNAAGNVQLGNDDKEIDLAVDNLASSKILREDKDQDFDLKNQFSKNRDDMDLEID